MELFTINIIVCHTLCLLSLVWKDEIHIAYIYTNLVVVEFHSISPCITHYHAHTCIKCVHYTHLMHLPPCVWMLPCFLHMYTVCFLLSDNSQWLLYFQVFFWYKYIVSKSLLQQASNVHHIIPFQKLMWSRTFTDLQHALLRAFTRDLSARVYTCMTRGGDSSWAPCRGAHCLTRWSSLYLQFSIM